MQLSTCIQLILAAVAATVAAGIADCDKVLSSRDVFTGECNNK